ncbi:MAG: hypothetical protein II304_11470 [Bacteroidales bacterium]|nr:hypothetical protein [Bacteroidales bacterium]
MSNIWHEPTETPKNNSDIIEHHKANDYDNHTLIEQYDIWTTGGGPANPFDEYTIRWAYVNDLLACEQELDRTRKALDVAVDALKSAKTRLELINNSKFANLNNVLQIQSQCEVLKINEALDQITALEQKD